MLGVAWFGGRRRTLVKMFAFEWILAFKVSDCLFTFQDAVVVQIVCSVVSQVACRELSCSVALAQGVAQKLQQRLWNVRLAINHLRLPGISRSLSLL